MFFGINDMFSIKVYVNRSIKIKKYCIEYTVIEIKNNRCIMEYFFCFLQAFILAVCISADVFVVSVQYSAQKINISTKGILLFNLICCGLMSGIMLFAHMYSDIISDKQAAFISSIILFIMGIWKIFEEIMKIILKKLSESSLLFSFLGFSFILKIDKSPLAKNENSNKSISPKEAAALSLALSFDAMATGFGSVLSKDTNLVLLVLLTFIIGCLACFWGKALGKNISSLPLPVSMLSGIVFIALAFLNYFH